jgi:hypothetical protein
MSIDVERLLREGMQRRRSQPIEVPPDLIDRVERRHRRRRAARAALAGGTVVVAAALVAVGLNAAVSSPPRRSARIAPPARTAAYVVRQVERAVAASEGRLIQYAYTVDLGPGGKPIPGYEASWLYGSEPGPTGTGDMRRIDVWGGRVHMAYGSAWADGKQTQTAVNYDSKTWDRGLQRLRGSSYKPPRCPVTLVPPAGSFGYSAFLRQALECGTFSVAGRATVDGVRTIEIVNLAASASVRVDYWVSPQTYLPVRLVYDTDTGNTQPGVDRTDEQTDFRWLAPTKANLALLDVRVPAGFRKDPYQILTNLCGFQPCN